MHGLNVSIPYSDRLPMNAVSTTAICYQYHSMWEYSYCQTYIFCYDRVPPLYW